MKAISKAIISVTKSVKNLEKNSKVGSGWSQYDGTKMFDVMTAFNAAMSENGLSVLTIDVKDSVKIERWQEERETKGKKPTIVTKQSVFTSVTVKYLLLHTSGESIELCSYGHGVDSQDKGSGKALTYSLKNLLINTFLTPVGKVEDTDKTHSKDIPVPQPQPKQKKLPNLPVAKYSDVAKFIQDGIGKDGVMIKDADRWPTIRKKYTISANAQKVIEGIIQNVPA